MANSRVGTSTSATARCCRVPVDELQREDRQRERRGLAGAGGGLAEQVAALIIGGMASRWMGVGSS
jgi:hypothetical protein